MIVYGNGISGRKSPAAQPLPGETTARAKKKQTRTGRVRNCPVEVDGLCFLNPRIAAEYHGIRLSTLRNALACGQMTCCGHKVRRLYSMAPQRRNGREA